MRRAFDVVVFVAEGFPVYQEQGFRLH